MPKRRQKGEVKSQKKVKKNLLKKEARRQILIITFIMIKGHITKRYMRKQSKKKKFSNQNIILANILDPVCMIDPLIKKGNRKRPKKLNGGGCMTSSQYPYQSIKAIEYFSINSYLAFLNSNLPSSCMYSYTDERIAIRKFNKNTEPTNLWIITATDPEISYPSSAESYE